MAKTVIGVGTAANDGTGDPLRTAFQACNANFTELYDYKYPHAAATDYSQFEADGTLKFNGAATVYNDIIINAGNLRGGGTPPSFLAFQNNIWQVCFQNSVSDIVYGSFELPHGYMEGTDLEVHLHGQMELTLNTKHR